MTQHFWSHKPWWCQPWSILLTGSIAIAGSWLLLQIWWITAGVALLVLAWWLGTGFSRREEQQATL